VAVYTESGTNRTRTVVHCAESPPPVSRSTQEALEQDEIKLEDRQILIEDIQSPPLTLVRKGLPVTPSGRQSRRSL